MPKTDKPRPAQEGALAEPRNTMSLGAIVALGLTCLGLWTAVLTPIQILLPQQIGRIDPGSKETALGWVTVVAAIGAILACPIVGTLSDRTTSRFGRRNPWIFGMALLVAVALAVQSQQHTILGVGICWFAVQVGINGMYAAVTAIIPDRVPPAQRGVVSAVVGIPLPVAVILGSFLVSTVVTDLVGGYLLLAAMALVLPLPLVFGTRDPVLPRAERPVVRLKDFWISPRQHPDFAWAAGGRFAIQLCNSVGTLYLLYYLGDVLRVANPAQSVFHLIAIYTVGILIVSIPAGRWSDRSGRRKVFVAVSSIVMAAGMLVLAVGDSLPAAFIAAGLIGLGYGVYVGIDQALITEVLPGADSRGKDLGVINVANSAPQAFAPAIAGTVIAVWHSYTVLYVAAAFFAVLSAVLVRPIRGVR